jgi:uncharacterized protein
MTRLKVRVQPRASRNEICGWQGEALKVRLTAPPVEGQANEALLRFLKEALGLKAGQVALVAGGQSRNKLVEINLEENEIKARIEKVI